MPKAITAERAASNREHHLTLWQSDYADIPKRIAEDIFRLAELYRRFTVYEYRMKVIDQNRRENAISMGVSIRESDERYSFEDQLKLLPEIIADMREREKKYKVKFGDIRTLDTKEFI